MNEQDWTTQDHPEPWEERTYRTGSTRPPKNYGGLIAVLVAAVVFLGGIVSVLGMMNIRIFKETRAAEEISAPVEFLPDETVPAASTVPPELSDSAEDQQHQLQISSSPQGIANIPQDGGLSLQEIYAKNIDSVVSISSTAGTGTGVVMSADGYIITNCHVVEGGRDLKVLFTDQTQYQAQVVGMDTVSDLAVLYVSATGLKPAEFGDSTTLQVGDAVAAIGDPLGVELRGTLTNGIVSAINRDITTGGRTMTLIQTNAALNSGNSGGPLLNCYGQVIGINTMKIGDYMNTNGVEGLGFAIPSATVKEIVDQLVSQGHVSGRPAVGFSSQTVTPFDQLYYRLPNGVYITHVESGSDAARRGLETGDILLQLDNQRITDTEALTQALYAYNAGDTVEIVIYRSGKQYALELTLEEAN